MEACRLQQQKSPALKMEEGRQVSSVGSQLHTELVLFHDLMPRPVTP